MTPTNTFMYFSNNFLVMWWSKASEERCVETSPVDFVNDDRIFGCFFYIFCNLCLINQQITTFQVTDKWPHPTLHLYLEEHDLIDGQDNTWLFQSFLNHYSVIVFLRAFQPQQNVSPVILFPRELIWVKPFKVLGDLLHFLQILGQLGILGLEITLSVQQYHPRISFGN